MKRTYHFLFVCLIACLSTVHLNMQAGTPLHSIQHSPAPKIGTANTSSADIQPGQEEEYSDKTSSIKNPSFENNGLANWINDGMQPQTNDSPTTEGWKKQGNTYAEKWVSSDNKLSNASLSQLVSGLPNGRYVVKLLAHSVNQSGIPTTTKGASAYAGIDETPINAGGEYSVNAVVVNGTLEIGFKTINTNANWVAFDHFRLYYYGEDLETYNSYLNRKLKIALKDTLKTERPGCFNLQQFRDAIEAAKNVEQTKEAVLAAILDLDAAINENAAILTAYEPLKLAIESFKKQLKDSEYPDKSFFEQFVTKIQGVYNSPEDQRSILKNTLNEIAEQSEVLSQYIVLKRTIASAKKLYVTTDYEGKTAFGLAVEAIQEIYNDPIGKNIHEAISRLNAATSDYLNTRPSNWTTIRNGALWKDHKDRAVQAHGAGFVQVGDTWYMIGEDRSSSWNPDVNMYSTKDFVNWKFERKIIQNGVTHPSLGNGRFIERPKIMYCKKTGKYVVWCHWEQGNYGASEAAVFYCDSVNGPYKFHWAGRPMGIKSRDCNVFVDNDGTAYFISTTEENQHLGLFKLSDDYLSVVQHTELFQWQQREAPAIVRVGDLYFMLFSACTGWDPNQTSYAYSKSLTSGWSGRTNIGNPIAYDTQAASILTIQGSEGTTHLYVGDRWQDPGLPESKTILFPIQFNGTSVTYRYRPQFDLDLATGTYRETSTENHVPKKEWKIRACSSEETSSENGKAVNAIDGNLSTKWHTRYSGSTPSAPHFIEVDMGAEYEVSGFLCTPRTDNSINGTIRNYVFLISRDGTDWEAVSGGTWLPYYGEVYFTPVKARYFRMVVPEDAYACIAEMDLLLNSAPYTPHTITPNYQIFTFGWVNSKKITVKEGARLTFGPDYKGTAGTWAFCGPNNLAAGTREYTVPAISPEDAGTYTSVFLNQYSQSSKVDYKVSVTPLSPIDTIQDERVEISRKYYDPQGLEIPYPSVQGVYIVKISYDNGTTGTERIFVNETR